MSDSWGGKRVGAGRPKGTSNPNTAKRREATRQIVERFGAEHPDAFQGDGVSLLQCIYKDPACPLAVRMDAAKSAAKYERPTFVAAAIKAVTPDDRGPIRYAR